MSLKNWSTTPGSNTSAPPAGAPESSTKLKDVNDILRQMMADVRTLAAPATVASAATTDLGASDETILTVSGTTTITAFGTVSAGIWKFVTFSGALTLTHNATSLILLGGANRTTVAGDCGLYVSLGSGNWKEYFYSPAGGYQPLDAQLTTLAGITAQQATDLAAVSTFMGTVLNDADGPTARATLGILVSGTATTASGTSVDFTGIPAGTKRINICLDTVSTNGTSNLLIQIGDSGGIETTGYRSGAINNGAQTGSLGGFLVTATMVAGNAADGLYTLVLLNSSTNNWVGGGDVVTNASTGDTHSGGGAKSLSATLDRVRITTVNGTDTFDTGTINIIYE